MSGQLVLAELDAFRSVLGKAQRREGETVTAWCRSTITNAVHRVGPTGPIKAAAEAAWTAADQLARALDGDSSDADLEAAREAAVDAVDALIVTVREIKAAGSNAV